MTPDNKKAVTAEERAKGLAYDISLFWCKEQHQQCEKAEEIIPLITEQIKEAEQAAYERGLNENAAPLGHEGFQEGFHRGIEAAAKLKEDSCNCYADGSAGCGDTCEDWQDAEAIRALTPPPF